MASVRDIAERIQVSVATVSRALNNHPTISPDTRDRVLKAANELGYQSSVGKRVTTNIGLAFTCDMPFSDFDGLLLAGMLRGVGEQRFDLGVVNVERDKADNETYSQLFMRKGLRGVILRTDSHSRQVCEQISEEGFPCVVVADRFENPRVNFIYGDSHPDSRRAVDHLQDLGHRRIGFVMNNIPDRDHADRLQGYTESLRHGGVGEDPGLIVRIGADLAGGRASLNRLLSLPNPPTAIYYADGLACLGAMCRARELRLGVPEDISLIGFDDNDQRFRVWPVMSAVCQNASQIGFEAALWLTRTLTGRESGPLRRQLTTTFEVHGTTGRPPAVPVRVLPDGTRLAPSVPLTSDNI
jgi:DNA-binding LacI/PurR family transcriptional regulator